MAISYALAGAAAGLIVGLTSTGGGALLTPALMFLGVAPSLCVGADVLASAGMKLLGGGIYAARGEVHWRTVGILATGSIPGAVLGIAVLNRFPRTVLDARLPLAVGAMVFAAGAGALVRLIARVEEARQMPSAAVTIALGFGTGLLVSTTSIGSGSLLLSAMSAMYPLGARALVGTDLAHALVVTSVATAGHWRAGRVDWQLALSLLAGGLPGVVIGARLAGVMPQRFLRLGLAVALVAIGVRLAWTGLAEHPPAFAAQESGGSR